MNKATIIFCVGLVVIFLVGCSAPTPQPIPTAMPTTDPAKIVAMAVNTVEAKMTNEAIKNPTATTPPTETPVPPTETAIPTITLTPTITGTIKPTLTGTITPTPLSDMQLTAVASGLSAKFLYASTYGGVDGGGNSFTPNERFGLAFGFKNTGTITWNGGYQVHLVKAVKEFTGQPGAFLPGPVKPGDKTEVNLWAYGSEDLGQHIWYYQLFTPNGIPVPGGQAVFYYLAH
jgi:hypothetical protein